MGRWRKIGNATGASRAPAGTGSPVSPDRRFAVGSPSATPRRAGIAVAICAAALSVVPAATPPARAQALSGKPIRIVVPFAAGVSEVAARTVGQRLSERWAQPVIIDPRPGANGIIAAEIVVRAPADGYTLLAGVDGIHSINPHIYRKLPYKAEDFVPIARLVDAPLILITHPSLPVSSVKELVVIARAQPGKLDYSSPGLGNTGHLAGEMFGQMAGVKLVHVPYKGGAQGLTALLSGEVTLMFSNVGNSLQFAQQKRVRVLATTAAKRLRVLPELPTIAELGYPGYEAVTWTGLSAPVGTPREVIAKLGQEVGQILRQPDIADTFHKQGLEPGSGTPESFAREIQAESARYGALVKKINFRID